MTAILGGIVSWILSPITKLIIYGLYNFFIRGPLQILNIENRVLDYASGSYTDKLLFDTSIMDGHPHLNFFTSTSPLKPFYMTMVIAGVVVLTIFFGFAIVSTFFKDKNKPGIVKKMGQVTLSASLVFLIPTAFLGGVSLAGSLMSTLKGGNISIGKKTVNSYQNYSSNQLAQLKGGSYNTYPFNKTIRSDFNGELYDYGITKNNKVPSSPWSDSSSNQNKSLSINEIYDYLIKKEDNSPTVKDNFQVSSDINVLAKESKSLYKTMNDQIISYNQGKSELGSTFNNKLNEIEKILLKLKPNYKSQVDADHIQEFISYANTTLKAILAWQESVNNILSYLPSKIKSPQDAAVNNLKVAYDTIYGDGLVQANSIETVGDLATTLGFFLAGDPKTGSGGLLTLNQYIANVKTSDLVVVFYQIVTGNKDTNWNQTFTAWPNNTGAMLIIGTLLIFAAILMLAGLILESFVRIGILGCLFILGGFFVPWSAIDNGARMKTWINMVIGQLISLFGVILILRFGFTLLDKFKDLLDSSPEFSGSDTGFLTRSILMAFFAYSVMVAAKRSRSMLLQLSGSNQGLLANGQSAGRLMKSMLKGSKIATAVGGAALGLSALNKSGNNWSGSTNNGSGKSGAGRLSNFKTTWARRAKMPSRIASSLDQGVSNVTRGKVGSAKAKISTLNNKMKKRNNKISTLQNKANWKMTKNDSLSNVQQQNSQSVASKAKAKSEFKESLKDFKNNKGSKK